ncbi:MAG: dTDP-4-dehydrorhamnose reductase [Gammaproteobacteria bacterium]|jgi:dTDP-4-dehydrorhamnose reductase
MKILVTGVSGQLGSEVVERFRQLGHAVVAADRRMLDLLQPGQAAAVIGAQQPDWVINCAAYTQVDKAESEPEQAFIINRDTPAQLARAVAAYGGRLLQLSTDFVFDGTQTRPYVEDDATNPLGVYGRSKLEGEQAVQRELPEAVILRTAWVYGVHGHNFVKTMLRLAIAGKPLRVVSDQRGSPTWTSDIVAAIVALVDQQASGVFHFTAAGETSWHGFASAILEEAASAGFTIKTNNVEPIATSEYPTPATRPAYSVLNTDKISACLPFTIPAWRDSLTNMLQEYATCADC